MAKPFTRLATRNESQTHYTIILPLRLPINLKLHHYRRFQPITSIEVVQRPAKYGPRYFGKLGSTPSFRGHFLFPVIKRQRHSPNVSWLIKFDPAMQPVSRIDVDNPSCSTLTRQVDVDRDFHSTTQPNCGRDKRSVKAPTVRSRPVRSSSRIC